MFFDTGSVVFEVELIAAQSVFLYSCPKRKMFWLRFLASFIACVALAYFFPRYDTAAGSIHFVLRSFAILAYSIGLTCVCYDLKPRAAISICVAGYAVQHIAYQFGFLISKIPGAEVLNNKLLGFIMYRELITMPVVFFFAWLLGGRKAAESRYFLDSDIRLDMISIFTICVCTVMTRVSYALCGQRRTRRRFNGKLSLLLLRRDKVYFYGQRRLRFFPFSLRYLFSFRQRTRKRKGSRCRSGRKKEGDISHRF